MKKYTNKPKLFVIPVTSLLKTATKHKKILLGSVIATETNNDCCKWNYKFYQQIDFLDIPLNLENLKSKEPFF